MKPSDITLSESTLTNLKSIEYQWIRTMHVEGYKREEINRFIRTCFGGNDVFADLLQKVALEQVSLYVLLQYVGCAPSNKEFR